MRGIERAGTFLICAAGVLLLLGVLLSAPQGHAQQSSLGGGGVTLAQVTNVVEALAGTNALTAAEVRAIVQSNAMTFTAGVTVTNNFKATNVVTRNLTNFGELRNEGTDVVFNKAGSNLNGRLFFKALDTTLGEVGVRADQLIMRVQGGTDYDLWAVAVNKPVTALGGGASADLFRIADQSSAAIKYRMNSTFDNLFDSSVTITNAAETFNGNGGGLSNLVGTAEAYDATGWNADSGVPTKDDVRDKIEALSVGAGSTNWIVTAADTVTAYYPGTDDIFQQAVAGSGVTMVAPAGVNQISVQDSEIPIVGNIDHTGDLDTSGEVTAASFSGGSATITGSGPGSITLFDDAANNTNKIRAATDITTDYEVVLPAAPATGFKRGVNASGVVTESYSEDGVTLTNLLEKNIVVTTNVMLGGQVIDFSRGTLQLTNFPAGNVEFTGIQGFMAGSTNLNWVTVDIQPDASAVRTLTVPATWFVSGFTNATVVAVTNGQWAELTVTAIIGRRTNASIVFWQ